MAIQDEIPKSRLTLRYKTEISGQPEDVTLPLRLLVTGDFSLGTSKDRRVDLEERRLRNMNGVNTDSVMRDMGIKLNFSVPNKVDPERAEEMEVTIPIDGMKSMSPDQIAAHVPKVRGLLKMKELLQEVVSNIDNRKEFRNLLNDLLSDEEAMKKLMEDLKGYESLKIGSGQTESE